MTAEFKVPARVAANIGKRHAAQQTALRCVYKCRAHARLYPCGARCDEHAPWAIAGRPNPDSQIDPTRTLDALRARMQKVAEDSGGNADPSTYEPSGSTTLLQVLTPTDTITQRFLAFHTANPHVYARVVGLVTDAVLRGDKRIGVGALFEQLRYSERTETNGDRYRLNNDYRAPMVRLLLEEHPEWADLFELRERKSA